MNAYQVPVTSQTVMHALTTPLSFIVNTRDENDQYDYVAQNVYDKMTHDRTDIPIITEAYTNALKSNSTDDQNEHISLDFLEMVEPASIISIMTVAILYALS